MATRADIEKVIMKLVSDIIKIPEDRINPKSHFQREIPVESIDLVNITLAVEERFNIEIQDSDVIKIWTFENLIDYVHYRLNPKSE